jgi:LysR family glycine cleavage system transcriptional activator
MNRRSPPWGAIEAFITASRFASFKEAAAQLGLSAPAFSRRIQTLEAHVGTRLFDRTLPVPALTLAGRRYLARLEPGYEAVRAATERMMPTPDRRPLRVAVSQSMAISWLLPRLEHFHAQERGIEVELHTRLGTVDLGGGAADVGLLYGDGHWPDLQAQKLLELEAFVVCAPELAGGLPRPAAPRDLDQHRLLEPLQPPNLWKTWSTLAGVPVHPAQERQYFDSMQVMYEAAARGLGLAIGVRPLVDPFLAEGRLVAAWPGTVPLPGGYHVAALPFMRREPAVRRFWQWIVCQAEARGDPAGPASQVVAAPFTR